MRNLINHEDAILLATAGNAIITLQSEATDIHFTYQIRAKKEDIDNPSILFVGLLTGSDNNSSYTYIGFLKKGINGQWSFTHGTKSRIYKEAKSVAAFGYTWHSLALASIARGVKIWHEGRCCCCGRRLTTPTSVSMGIGPECAGMLAKKQGVY